MATHIPLTGLPRPGQFPELDAETRVPALIGVSVAFATASTIAVGLRLYTRGFVIRALGIDDATIAFAQILSIGVSVATILQAKYALGIHIWLTNPAGNMAQLKAFLATSVIYNFAQIVTKISFLLQYRRIFTEGRTRVVCFWFLIFLVVWGLAQEVFVVLSCVPLAILVPSMQGKCMDVLLTYYLTSIMNIVTDFLVFALPIPAVKKLALRTKQKMLVISIFGLGFFACIISVVRLFYLRIARDSPDPTWESVPVTYWTVVELNCGIICACLPTLRPLLRRVFPSLTQRSENSDGAKDSNGDRIITIGGSSGKKRKPRRQFTLTTVTDAGTSTEELQMVSYDAGEHARHPGGMSRLSTAIHGGKGRKEGAHEEGERKITVTREIGMKESSESM